MNTRGKVFKYPDNVDTDVTVSYTHLKTEYEFLRTLIENEMIPEDVTVQVLTQCREPVSYTHLDVYKRQS